MRVLTFQGQYAYKKSEIFSGFVCWVHFEENDTPKIIEKAGGKLIEMAQSSPIILVPFAHLYEAVAPVEIARTLFNTLETFVVEKYPKVIIAPFQKTKELHLNVPSDDYAIKFLNF